MDGGGMAMGHYSHVFSAAGTGTTSSQAPRGPRRLRLLDVSVMAMRAEVQTIAFWRAVIAECLATLLLVLFGCLATLTCDTPRDVPRDTPRDVHTLLVALGFGLTVGSLVQSFAHISGAHLNPVVSTVHVLTGKVTPLRYLLYVTAQCAGAVAGAAILHGVTRGSCQGDLGSTALKEGISAWQGLGIEILLTFLFLFTLCATNDPNNNNNSSSSSSNNKAIIVGLAVAGCHIAGYRWTGSSMNPARSLGPAFVAGNWTQHWVYWAGPTLGGVAAGLLYEFIFDPSRTRSRSHLPTSLDPEDGMATTSLTNPAHYPHPRPSSPSPLPALPRHYYCNNNNTSATAATTTAAALPPYHPHHNHYHPHPPSSSPSASSNLLGSPRPSRRDLPPSSSASSSSPSSFPSPSLTSINKMTNVTGAAVVSSPTPLPLSNLYVPGTYGGVGGNREPPLMGDNSRGGAGEHLLLLNNNVNPLPLPLPPPRPHPNNSYYNSNNTTTTNTNRHNSSDDLFAPTVPPIPSRRGDVRPVMTYAPPPPPPQRRQAGAVVTPAAEDVSPGRENQAYSFDSNPRRLQSTSSASSHPATPALQSGGPLNFFHDGRESICLSDVRVF